MAEPNFFAQFTDNPEPAPGVADDQVVNRATSSGMDFSAEAEQLASANRRSLMQQMSMDIYKTSLSHIKPDPNELYHPTTPPPDRNESWASVKRGFGGYVQSLGSGIEHITEAPNVPAYERSEILDAQPSRLGTLRYQPRPAGQVFDNPAAQSAHAAGSAVEKWGKGFAEAQGVPPVPNLNAALDSWSALGSYAWHSALEGLGSTAVPIATGFGATGLFGAGAGAASVIGTSIPAGYGQLRSDIESEAEKLRKDAQTARDMGLMNAATKLDAVAQNLTPEKQRSIINVAGLIVGSLDSIVPMAISNRVAQQELSQLTARHVIKAITLHMATGAAEEGTTEAIQQSVSIIGRAQAKGIESAKDYADELYQKLDEIVESGVKGAAAGALFGAAVGGRHAAGAGRGPQPEQQAPDFSDPAMHQPTEVAAIPPEQAPQPDAAQPSLSPTDVTEGQPAAQETPAITSPEIEQAVELWKQAQASTEGIATEAADGARPSVSQAVETVLAELPPETQAQVQPVVQAIEQALPDVAETVSEGTAQVPHELRQRLEQLGIAQATTEQQVREIMAQQEAARPSQQLQAYLAQNGSLTGAPEAIAKAAGMSSPGQLSRAIREGISSGALRQTMTGRIAPAQNVQPRTAQGVKQTIADIARAMAPILPRGTTVRSFRSLADIPARHRTELEQSGADVVSKVSGEAIDAVADGNAIYLAEYAVNPVGRLSHEAVHAIKSSGLISDQEIALLAERARKIGVFGKRREATYAEDYKKRFTDWKARVEEEAAAHLIEARVNGQDFGRKINGIIDRVLEYVRRLGNALRGMGFQTTDDVANALLSGEMARRQAVQAWMRENDITALAVREAAPDAMFALGDRERGIPKTAVSLHSFPNDSAIKAHRDYAAAKAGDREAAERMVLDLVTPQMIEQARSAFGPDAIYVPVVAQEAGGRNKIPEVVAYHYAEETGAHISTDIVQSSRAFHTGARPLDRLLGRPMFDGPVRRGGRYVLVDDVSVMGGTLAELANHIQQGGGEVSGVVTLVNASRTGVFTPTKAQLNKVEARYGELIRQELGIAPSGLTADEASVLLNYRDADALRDQLVKARGERDSRLVRRASRGTPEEEGGDGGVNDGGGAMFAFAGSPVEPIRAYHGSRADDPFVAFDQNKALSIGVHFGESPITADWFSGYGYETAKAAPSWTRRGADIEKLQRDIEAGTERVKQLDVEIAALRAKLSTKIGLNKSALSWLEAQRSLVQSEVWTAGSIIQYARAAEGGRIVPVDLDIRRPLIIEKMVEEARGNWDPSAMGVLLRQYGVPITDDDMVVLKAGDDLPVQTDAEATKLMGSRKDRLITKERALANALLRQRIMDAGYDAIQYRAAEGPYSWAYIPVKPGTVRSATSGQAMFAFAGERAKTADNDALARAKQMDSDGTDRTKIWTDTGWFKGVDGKWRFEIDDRQFEKGLWKEALRDKKRAYESVYGPIFGANSIEHLIGEAIGPLGVGGAAGAGAAAAGLSPMLGVATAGIAAMAPIWGHVDQVLRFRQARRAAAVGDISEVEARAVQKRLDMTPEQRAARPPWLDYDVPEDQQIVRGVAKDDGSMFALADQSSPDEVSRPEVKSLQSIIADLARDLGLVMRQGLTRSAAGKAAAKAGLSSVYDPATGVLRVTSVSDIQAVAGAVAPVLRHRFGRALDKLISETGHELRYPATPEVGDRRLSPMQTRLADLIKTHLEFSRVEAEAPTNVLQNSRAEKLAADERWRIARDSATAAFQRVARVIGPEEATRRRDAVLARLGLSEQIGLTPVDPTLIDREIRHGYDADLAPRPPTRVDVAEASEGFADFIRQYLMNPANAKAKYPRFTHQFEMFLDKQDPILLAKLESAQEAIDAYYKADPTRFVDAIIHDPVKQTRWERFQADADQWGYRGALAMRLNSFYTATIDQQNPMFTATWELLNEIKRVTGTTTDLPAALNPYKLLRLAPHSHAWATRDMENGIRDYTTNEHAGPGLITALTTALGPNRRAARDTGPGSIYRAFSSYLVARYAAIEWQRFADGTKERPPTVQPPRSGNPAQAVAAFKEAQAQLEAKYPAFAEAAMQIYDYQQNLLKLQRDAGLIKPETYDLLIQDREYVPFYREFDENENVPSRALGTGASGVLKRKRGSDRNVIDPVASIAQKTFETRSIIAINDVKKNLLRLAEAAGPGGGVIAERLDRSKLVASGIDVDKIVAAAADDLDLDGSDIPAQMTMAHQILGNDAVATYYTQKSIPSPGRPPIVFFFENGEVQAMQLGNGSHGHKLSSQMLDNLNTFGKIHNDAMSALMVIGRSPAQITRVGITTHPEFAAANIVRDALMAFQYDARAIPMWTQIKGMIDVARGADYVQRYYANAGMMGGEATAALDKLRTDRDIRALVQRGYKFKLFDSLPNMLDRLSELFEVRNWKDRAVGAGVGAITGAAVGGPVGAAMGATFGGLVGGSTIVKVGEASETATRAQLFEIAYQRALDNGLDAPAAAQEAAFWAHEYTDYSRRGSKMEAFGAMIPFLNASLQGNDVYIRRLLGKGDQSYTPGLMYPLYRLGLLDITALSAKEQQQLGESAWTWGMTIFGLGAITAAVAMLWDDDERIKDIDDRVKASHWLIPIGDEIYRVPKPFQTTWFSQLIERYITEAAHGNARWFEHYIEDLWNTWKSPIVPAIAEVGATMLGYDINSGRQIIPDNVKRANPDRKKQFDAYTSEFGKWAGPKLDMSPMYVDHMINKFGASWGRTALSLNVPGTPWYNENKPIKGPEEEFIARRFMWKAGRGSEAGQALRQIMGAEEPLNLLWGRLAQPYSNLKKSADNYKDLIQKPVPDHAGAVGLLEAMTPYERGYALMEGTLTGPGDAKYRLLHPMNRAAKMATELLKMEKEIVGGEMLTGRKGKDQKEIPMSPTEKTAARDMLTQLRMMETHNALVLTEETGWKGRMLFRPDEVLGELKAAAPKAHKELLSRFQKAGILPWDGVAKVWPEVKARLEDERMLERARRNRLFGAGAQFSGLYERARFAKPGSYLPAETEPADF